MTKRSPSPAARFGQRLHRWLRRPALRRAVALLLSLALALGPLQPVNAIPANAPQVMLAVTNSSSMDGTTSGAIMVGSGSTGQTQFANSSSPTAYTVASDFTPPISNNGDGTANYTAACPSNSSYLCDNGPSRLNMAKAAISSILSSYGNLVNFGLYDYALSGSTPSASTTWVYYMSPSGGGFTFTNTAGGSQVANPCYNYTSLGHTVSGYLDCLAVDGHYSSSIGSLQYMNVGDTSDNALINDVLYAGSSLPTAFVTYSGPSPATPWPPNFSISKYNNGQVSIGYSSTTGGPSSWSTSPTNAGYVPYASEVFFSLRGFGYNGSVSATTGNLVAQIGTSATSSTFTNALQPETSNKSTAEIKSVAGQSPIAGLMKGILGNYNSNVSKTSCQQQYVVLLTDGLPTLDLAGKNWPPAGTTAATNYGVTASFNADGSLNTAGTNSQALLDAISQITALNSAGIKTYVIGLGAGVNSAGNPVAAQVLTAMAVAGGTTSFYAADTQSSLNSAFAGIVSQIYSAASITAPVAPLSLASGTGYEYTLVNQPSPLYGSVQAFAATANGTTASTASWDASSLMTASGRSSALYSTKSDNTTIALLSALDTAAFSLTASTCVPNVATILGYTNNPAYSGVSGCSYLAGRATGYYVGGFSNQNAARYVGPPANSALVSDSSYVSYATGLSTRTPLLMFTSNDGFLYGVNATSGALVWGWIPRNLVSSLQNYASFQSNQYMNGDFAVLDAKPSAAGAWGSYVVGSAQGGKEHFSLKLGSNAIPSSVVYDTVVSGGSAPGDKTVVSTGGTPQHAPVQIAYVSGVAYALYVVNTGTSTVTSTLYEVNVASGASTSATLPGAVSSSLYYSDQTRTLWLGLTSGALYSLGITGNAATDVPLALNVGNTVNPASSSTAVTNILYAGYSEIAGVPYAWAVNPSQITVFTVGSSGWTTLWASTTTSGYTYSSSGFTASSTINALQGNGVVSDLPLLASGALVVPQYVPASSGCGAGSGYYGLFDLRQGIFPTSSVFSYQGTAVTNDVLVGSGAAFTPGVVVTTGGVNLTAGSSGLLSPAGSLTTTGLKGPAVAGWRISN